MFFPFVVHSHLSLRGLVSLGDGRAYVLEPSPDRSAADGAHRVYRAEHLALPTGSCGHHLLNLSDATAGAALRGAGWPEHSQGLGDFSGRVKLKFSLFTFFTEKPSSYSALCSNVTEYRFIRVDVASVTPHIAIQCPNLAH